MTQSNDTLDISNLVSKVQDLRGFEMYKEILETVLQVILEAERDEHVGVQPYQRGDERRDTRSGYKPRTLQTPVGTLQLRKPQTRLGMKSNVLDHYERIDQAVLTTISEMYVQGVSTRKVERLLEKTIGEGLSASTVSKANKRFDEAIKQLKQRELREFPILIVDARFDKVRQEGAIRSAAFLTIIGIDAEGHRHVLDFMATKGETKHYWKTAFKGMKKRGLCGVRWMVSDDHEGLKQALFESFVGAVWQRCQVHIARNVSNQTPSKDKKDMAGRLKDVFTAPDQEEGYRRLKVLAAWAEERKKGLGDYIEEIVPQGFSVFILPASLRRKLRTTNLVERINQELKRRTKVVRIFPNLVAYERLAGTLLVQMEEDWVEKDRKYLNASLLIETLDEKFGLPEGKEVE